MARGGSRKVTSKSVARKASSILRSNRFSAKARSVAGSALSQARGKRRGK
jgi:hypothetical protein